MASPTLCRWISRVCESTVSKAPRQAKSRKASLLASSRLYSPRGESDSVAGLSICDSAESPTATSAPPRIRDWALTPIGSMPSVARAMPGAKASSATSQMPCPRAARRRGAGQTVGCDRLGRRGGESIMCPLETGKLLAGPGVHHVPERASDNLLLGPTRAPPASRRCILSSRCPRPVSRTLRGTRVSPMCFVVSGFQDAHAHADTLPCEPAGLSPISVHR